MRTLKTISALDTWDTKNSLRLCHPFGHLDRKWVISVEEPSFEKWIMKMLDPSSIG